MTEHDTDGPSVSRRAVLRSGAVAAGGAALLPGVASAHECPRSPGYWAHHEWPSTIPDPFEISGVTMSVAEWQAFLLAPPTGDKANIMAKHLVTTVVNFQFRGALPEGDPGCVDEPLPAFGGRTVRQIRLAAERWLDASSFDDPETSQETWIAGGVNGEPLKNALDAFNNDRLGLDCDCGEEDGENGDANGETNTDTKSEKSTDANGETSTDAKSEKSADAKSADAKGDATDGPDGGGPPDDAGGGPPDDTGGGPPGGVGGGPSDEAGRRPL